MKAVAWKVEWDGSEGTAAEVVFAETAAAALSLADTDELEEDTRATRVPRFDGCRPGADLARAQLADWWEFGCDDCGHRVDGDGCMQCEEDGEGLSRDPFVSGAGAVYCDRGCYLNRYAGFGRSAGNRLGACLDAVEKWPGIEIVSANGIEYSQEKEFHNSRAVGGIDFRFPGGVGVARWVRGDARLSVDHRDRDAWMAFAEDCKRVTPTADRGQQEVADGYAIADGGTK